MTQFIAEIGSNHNGRLERAFDLIDTAAAIGCAGVKFQVFDAKRLYAQTEKQEQARPNELPLPWVRDLCLRAHANGLLFGCSVFDQLGPRRLVEVCPAIDFLKVSSYSVLDHALLDAVGRVGKPVMLSTGMATDKQISRAVAVVTRAEAPLVLLHAVSAYPTPAAQANLQAIDTLRVRYDGLVQAFGWSDHTVDPAVVLRAIWTHRAEVVEVHLDLDGRGEEYNGEHCWLSGPLADVIETAARGVSADGTGELGPQPCEQPEVPWRADPEDGLRPMKFMRV